MVPGVKKRMTICPSNLPKYKREEEVWNATSHFIGTILSIGICIVFIIYQVSKNMSISFMWPFYLYVLFMMVMFTMSGIYHSRKLGSKERAICRIIDHSDIYLFISATYAPVCLYGLNDQKLGLIIIAINWSLSIIAVILNLINIDNKIVKIISYVLYIMIGWMIVFIYPIIQIDTSVFAFLLSGGIVFTIGAILYAIGKHKKWFHTIFHFFVLAGVILQFISILLLLNMNCL